MSSEIRKIRKRLNKNTKGGFYQRLPRQDFGIKHRHAETGRIFRIDRMGPRWSEVLDAKNYSVYRFWENVSMMVELDSENCRNSPDTSPCLRLKSLVSMHTHIGLTEVSTLETFSRHLRYSTGRSLKTCPNLTRIIWTLQRTHE